MTNQPKRSEPKAPVDKGPNRFVVRMGVLRQLGLMTAPQKMSLNRGDMVVCRTKRGQETGEVLCKATPQSVEAMESYTTGHIQYEMSESDFQTQHRLDEKRQETMEKCREHAKRLRVEMELIDVEYLYGGFRLVIYYLAEGRIDFRQLVKNLASEFQTKIEMKQIGIRDEAKLLADYGDCGKPVCCNTHLSAMPPVSMKMAKLQRTTLDPNKISGRCGRLKCCLRYEYDTYKDMQKSLPPIGSRVLTRDGRFEVLGHEILSQQIVARTEDNRRILLEADQIISVKR